MGSSSFHRKSISSMVWRTEKRWKKGKKGRKREREKERKKERTKERNKERKNCSELIQFLDRYSYTMLGKELCENSPNRVQSVNGKILRSHVADLRYPPPLSLSLSPPPLTTFHGKLTRLISQAPRYRHPPTPFPLYNFLKSDDSAARVRET